MGDKTDKRSEKLKKSQTLTDEDIQTNRVLDRRSLMRVLAVGAVGTAGVALGARPAAAQLTDADGGPCADPGGRGRGVTGVTDNDGGATADPVGNGRFSGMTDSDGGGCADPAGQGRGAQSGGGGGRGAARPTDSDGGAYADPASQGRGGVRTGRTDNDSGAWADPPGGGRWGSGLTDSDQGPNFTDQVGNGRRGF